MFDAEQLLGSLVKSSLGSSQRRRRRGRGFFSSSIGRTIGAGLVGVAVAAFDSYQKSQEVPEGMPRPMVPPLPPGVDEKKAPPPPPPGSDPVNPPPPPSPKTPDKEREREAVTLLHAMIAAAAADGNIDDSEREHIMKNAQEAGPEAVAFVADALSNPKDIQTICDQVSSPELAEQVYLVSALAIEIDTEEEKQYLANLAQHLKLSEETLQNINSQLEL
jgi:uncharacterized membrane protein YebE (DUF533 family)